VHGVLPTAGRSGDRVGSIAATLHWRPGGAGPWSWWPGGAGRIVPCPDPAALGTTLAGLLAPVVGLDGAAQARTSDGPRDRAERGELRRLIEARIDRLPEVLRSVFVLRAVEELSVAERPPRPILMGRHLLALGIAPGPEVGRIVQAVYERQLDGAVTDLESAIEDARRMIGGGGGRPKSYGDN